MERFRVSVRVSSEMYDFLERQASKLSDAISPKPHGRRAVVPRGWILTAKLRETDESLAARLVRG